MRRTLLGSLATLLALAGLQLGMTLRDHVPAQNDALADRALSLAASVSGAASGPIVRKGDLVQVAQAPLFTVQVLGIYDIFLAGKAYPFAVSSPYGRDTAGRNSPAALAVTSRAGSSVTISAQTVTRPPNAADANGRLQASILAGSKERGASANAVSNVIAPLYSLVAVFTGATAGGPIPGTLDYRSRAVRDARTVRPRLNQVFFVGTGRTSSGSLKQFIVPKGSAQLWLGVLDHLGDNHRLSTAYQVSVIGNAPAIQPYMPILVATATSTATVPASPPPPTAIPGDTVFPTDTPSPVVTPLLPPDTDTPTAPTPTLVAGAATASPLPTLTITPQNSATASPTLTATATLTSTPSATLTATSTVTPTATLLIFPTPH